MGFQGSVGGRSSIQMQQVRQDLERRRLITFNRLRVISASWCGAPFCSVSVSDNGVFLLLEPDWLVLLHLYPIRVTRNFCFCLSVWRTPRKQQGQQGDERQHSGKPRQDTPTKLINDGKVRSGAYNQVADRERQRRNRLAP